MDNVEMKLAVLIDAENISHSKFNTVMEEVNKFGIPTIKRVYADWTNPHISGWRSLLMENAVIPVQQYSYVSGKNSTDSTIIIDAMDILYTKMVNGFCIISSDSDFTRLVLRLREGGMKVFGFGEKKTPNSLIRACDKFTFIEILDEAKDEKETNSRAVIDDNLIKLISSSIDYLADEDGWVYLATLGSFILKKQPEFDPRNYGFAKLFQLINSIDLFETDEKVINKRGLKQIYVRKKGFSKEGSTGTKKIITTKKE